MESLSGTPSNHGGYQEAAYACLLGLTSETPLPGIFSLSSRGFHLKTPVSAVPEFFKKKTSALALRHPVMNHLQKVTPSKIENRTSGLLHK